MTDHAFDTNVEGLKAALADRYVIERELGQGGMATVFLAQDVKHDRKVALKLLKPELGAIVGGDRFLAEIRTTANLQHPNILPLFDSGESDGMLFYVMPFIEGESLRDRIDREKQLSVDEAITMARKIADALDYAHEHGVVHRDIKPANILVTERGEPLVADFGIALAVSEAGGGRITETGLSLGTPHYMSPEQATGDRDIDPRSDIYALGCVLYEMLAGQPPFAAPTAQGVLVRILTEHPRSITDLRHTVPPHVSSVLARALEKLPADRFPNAGEFNAALADEAYRYTAVPQPVPDTPPAGTQPVALEEAAAGPTSRTPLIATAAVAGLAVIAAIAGWSRSAPEPPAPAPPLRAELDIGDADLAGISAEIVISPDGSRFAAPFGNGGAFINAPTDGIFIRNSDEPDFRLIPGTEGASQASFSPDSEWLVYADQSGLFKVSVDGGAPQPILQSGELARVTYPSWGEDGWVVFSAQDGIYRVRNTGGEPEHLLGNVIAYEPSAIPGDKVLFGGISPPVIQLLDLQTDSVTTLVTDAIDPTYVEATGHLLWIDLAHALWGAPFDPESGTITGERSLLIAGISAATPLFGRYSISRDGTLAYSWGAIGGFRPRRGDDSQLVIAGLDGELTVVELDPRRIQAPEWSPDGRLVAYGGTGPNATDETSNDIWVYDVELESAPRRRTNTGNNNSPIWSPDGTRIAFSSQRDGSDAADLYVKVVDSDEPPSLVVSLPGFQTPMDWPSEDILVFENFGRSRGEGYGIFVVDPADSTSVRAYWTPEADANGVQVSPDGTLAAYDSNESEQREVYVRSFPEPRAETLISERGGRWPYWSAGGDTLFYFNLAQDSLFAAHLRLEPTPAVLSRTPVLALRNRGGDLSPDGTRFITTRVVQPGAAPDSEEPVRERHFVVTNWFEELRARTGGSEPDDR